MSELHPINQTLLTILENQLARRQAAFEDLDTATFLHEPPGECNSILGIGRHLIILNGFILTLLESPLASEIPDPESVETVDQLNAALDASLDLVRTAIIDHDPADWYETPDTPREGPWGEEPTIRRVTRPLNDFVNHLGSIRVIRRLQGCPCERTQ